MRMVILGCGTALPVAHKGPSGALISTGDTTVLFDCGSGTAQKLIAAGGDLKTLDAIILSHAHLDHIGDLPTLLFALRMPEIGREAPLFVYHSQPLAPYLARLRAAFGDWLDADGYEIHYCSMAPGDHASVGALELEGFPVHHTETSLGFRFRGPDGEVLAMPSDTGLCDGVIGGAADADCLVIECANTDETASAKHMAPKDIVHLSRIAKPRALVITHLYPNGESAGVVAQIRAAASCPVIEAYDGLVLDVLPGGLADASAGNPRGKAAEVVRDGAVESEIRDLMEAELAKLAGLDTETMLDQKFRDAQPAATPGPAKKRGPAREWTSEALAALTPSRVQRRLAKRASGSGKIPVLNLRRTTVPEARRQLARQIPKWALGGVKLAEIVTGKGRRSAGEPVVKLAVLNWLDSAEGRRWVGQWAPVITASGGFGSVVLQLK